MAKSKDDLQKELDELRAEVRALSESRKPGLEATTAPDGEEEGPEGVDFEGLVDSLRQEIEELPAMTTLAVFTLGLVVGRLLAQ